MSDSDIEDFENEVRILGTEGDDEYIENNIVAEIVKEEPKDETRGRKPRKQKLIDDILKFKGYCPELVETPSKLKSMKVKQLEQLLARCVAVCAGLGLKDTKSAPPPEMAPQSTITPTATKPNGGQILYMANIGLISTIEKLSQQTSDMTGYEIEGWCASTQQNKEQLIEILSQVYAENNTSGEIDKYLSATGVWGMMMLTGAMSHTKKKVPT